MFRKAFAVWLLLLVLAVLNGAARTFFIEPRIGGQAGHVAGTLILCALIFLVAGATIGWMGIGSPKEAFAVGLAWLLLTVAFEFLAGRYLFRTSWDVLLADYDLAGGRIWILVLLSNLAAPAFWFQLKGK